MVRLECVIDGVVQRPNRVGHRTRDPPIAEKSCIYVDKVQGKSTPEKKMQSELAFLKSPHRMAQKDYSSDVPRRLNCTHELDKRDPEWRQ